VNKRRALILPAVLIALVLFVVAGIYLAEPAHSLPSFFPGHVSSGAEYGHHHTKHGIAAAVLGLGCLVFAWFQSGPATSGQSPA